MTNLIFICIKKIGFSIAPKFFYVPKLEKFVSKCTFRCVLHFKYFDFLKLQIVRIL